MILARAGVDENIKNAAEKINRAPDFAAILIMITVHDVLIDLV